MLELEAARIGAEAALDEVTDSTKRALDLPAKVRRNPLKSAALLGGTGFLLAGGPRRVLRFALGRARSETRDPHAGLLPDEIEKVLRDSGLANDPEIRRALDEDFAEYLRAEGPLRPGSRRRRPCCGGRSTSSPDRWARRAHASSSARIMSAEKDRESARAELRAAARARESAPGRKRSRHPERHGVQASTRRRHHPAGVAEWQTRWP